MFFFSQVDLDKYLANELDIPLPDDITQDPTSEPDPLQLTQSSPPPPLTPQTQEHQLQHLQQPTQPQLQQHHNQYLQPLSQLDAEQQSSQSRRKSASQIDEFFDVDLDVNLWGVESAPLLQATPSDNSSEKSLWNGANQQNTPQESSWLVDEFINDNSCMKGSSTYVSPFRLENSVDDEVFIKPEPVENRTSIWEEVTNSVRHLDPEDSISLQLSSSAPSSLNYPNVSNPTVSHQQHKLTSLQCSNSSQHYPPVTLNQNINQVLIPPASVYSNDSQLLHSQDIKLEDSAQTQAQIPNNEVSNFLTSPSPPLNRPNVNTQNFPVGHYRHPHPNNVSPMLSAIPGAHRMYTPPTPPSSDHGSPGDLHVHFPHFPVPPPRRTPPPPYTVAASSNTSRAQTIHSTSSTPVTNISPATQRQIIPNFSNPVSVIHRQQMHPPVSLVSSQPVGKILLPPTPNTSIQTSTLTRRSFTSAGSTPSSSGGVVIPRRTSVVNSCPSGSSSASQSSATASSPLPKYSRRNNPELDKRRIHHCDFQGV